MQSIEKSFYYSAKRDFLILPNANSIPTASNFSSFGKIIIEGQQERENKPSHADIENDLKGVIKSPLSIEEQKKINSKLQSQESYQKRKKIKTLKKEVEDFSRVYKRITNLNLTKENNFHIEDKVFHELIRVYNLYPDVNKFDINQINRVFSEIDLQMDLNNKNVRIIKYKTGKISYNELLSNLKVFHKKLKAVSENLSKQENIYENSSYVDNISAVFFKLGSNPLSAPFGE